MHSITARIVENHNVIQKTGKCTYHITVPPVEEGPSRGYSSSSGIRNEYY